ncbi:MAG: Lrp/AsnC family transcriptional regulator [Candidatus Thorarchaeota archaeon]|nr:MAG: Lrp/AsnC family transcriptional regulator [Candidatus Thorarchaeota archaeon]
MDRMDRKLIRLLDANCRVSYQDMAAEMGVSPTAVKRRVEKLVDTGVILGFRVLPSLAMMEADIVVAIICTDGSENREEIVKQIGATIVFHHISTIVGTEEGIYFAIGWYIGLAQFSEVGKILRSLSGVTRVDMHSMLWSRGASMTLTSLQKRVLRILKEDARMPIPDIAKETGISARRVRRIVKELQDSEAFRFRIRWNMSTGEKTQFILGIGYKESEMSGYDIVEWLQEEFEAYFWEPYISAMEPKVFGNFVVDTLRDVESITQSVRAAPFVQSVATYVCLSNYKTIRHQKMWLENLLEQEET